MPVAGWWTSKAFPYRKKNEPTRRERPAASDASRHHGLVGDEPMRRFAAILPQFFAGAGFAAAGFTGDAAATVLTGLIRFASS